MAAREAIANQLSPSAIRTLAAQHGYLFSGMNWLAVKVAPAGSARTAKRTHGPFCGSARTEPPSSRAHGGLVRVVDGEGDAPARWGAVARKDRRDDVLKAVRGRYEDIVRMGILRSAETPST